ncbi:MAG TPA: HTH domain-containing protein, partial [Phycisphaerales bacterium]|nr:HTH domain-containing protein [Phycisphaerales bacterium]
MTRLTRILTLHRSLLNDDPPKDAKQWADHFEVNVRTVLRDLAFLRDEMKAPLRYDQSIGGYRYEDT